MSSLFFLIYFFSFQTRKDYFFPQLKKKKQHWVRNLKSLACCFQASEVGKIMSNNIQTCWKKQLLPVKSTHLESWNVYNKS